MKWTWKLRINRIKQRVDTLEDQVLDLKIRLNSLSDAYHNHIKIQSKAPDLIDKRPCKKSGDPAIDYINATIQNLESAGEKRKLEPEVLRDKSYVKVREPHEPSNDSKPAPLCKHYKDSKCQVDISDCIYHGNDEAPCYNCDLQFGTTEVYDLDQCRMCTSWNSKSGWFCVKTWAHPPRKGLNCTDFIPDIIRHEKKLFSEKLIAWSKTIPQDILLELWDVFQNIEYQYDRDGNIIWTKFCEISQEISNRVREGNNPAL